MKNEFFLEKYPDLGVQHFGKGKLFYVELVYKEPINNQEIPIRVFELCPTADKITKIIDINRDKFDTPVKLLVHWGRRSPYVPYWVTIAIIAIGLMLTYFYFGHIQITFSLASLIICFSVLSLLFWLITIFRKISMGMSEGEAINPFIRPYGLSNSDYMDGWESHKAAVKREWFQDYKDYLD